MNFRQFSLMITRFNKEIHSLTINDDEFRQKDAILNWTVANCCQKMGTFEKKRPI